MSVLFLARHMVRSLPLRSPSRASFYHTDCFLTIYIHNKRLEYCWTALPIALAHCASVQGSAEPNVCISKRLTKARTAFHPISFGGWVRSKRLCIYTRQWVLAIAQNTLSGRLPSETLS